MTLHTATNTTTIRPTARRRAAARLSAAMACAALACGVGATAATAEEYVPGDRDLTHGVHPWIGPEVTSDHREIVFTSRYNWTADDVTVTLRPVAEDGTLGDGVEVPFIAEPRIDGGVVDVVETRRTLREEGTGQVAYEFAVDGQDRTFTVPFEADADLADDVPAPPVPVGVGEELADTLADAPDAWTRNVLLAPDTGYMHHEQLAAPGEIGTEDGTRTDTARITVGAAETAELDTDGDGVVGYGLMEAPIDESSPAPGEGDSAAGEDTAPGGGDGGHTVPEGVDTGGEAIPLLAAGAGGTAATLVGAAWVGHRRAQRLRRSA